MTDPQRASLRLIIAAADAWLPLAPLGLAGLDTFEPLYEAGWVDYWPESPDGPAVTLTPLGARLCGVHLQERVETRTVTVAEDNGKWWADADERRVKVRDARRKEVVPKWWDDARPCPPPVQPQHRHEVPLWFPERVVDPRPGPLDELIAAEAPPRVLMGVVVQPLKRRAKDARVKPPGPVRRTG